ncbi:MAG: Ni/Fe-hydrogenase, b-type cytochrome subunit [Coriobacteriia bacterium]
MSHGAYREAHPLPATLMHWSHLISMVALGFTGFYIHKPFFNGNMELMRTLHFIFMYVVLITLVCRIYWAFMGGGSTLTKGTREIARDRKNWGFQEENKGQFFETIKYYLFLRKTHPISGKYNPMQKTAYLAMIPLLIAQGYTGFAIYGPAARMTFFSWGTSLVGGLMIMREIHFFIMWVFILITMIHVYLSLAEDIEALPLMFFQKETPAKEH